MAGSSKPPILLLKLAVFVALVSISYVILLIYCYSSEKYSYNAAVLDKILLLKKTSSPKIVFVGGSNLAFGLDSARVKEEFGYPVVNMGLAVGLGLKFMLDQVNSYIKKGDIVVVVPEYELFLGDFRGDEPLFDVAGITNNWHLIANMATYRVVECALMRNQIIVNKIFNCDHSYDKSKWSYSRKNFDENGDVTDHIGLSNMEYSKKYTKLDASVNSESVSYFLDFIIKNQGCQVNTIMLYPCARLSYYRFQKDTIVKIDETLRSKGISVLSSPQDFVYDDDFFSIRHII